MVINGAMDALGSAMQEAAERGGRILSRHFNAPLTVEEKSTVADYRTEADVESEAAIIEVLANRYPDYNTHSEERGLVDRGSPYTFIVDPLDGSNNYVLGLPDFSIIIALTDERRTERALVYHPVLGWSCTAERGKGSFQDGTKLAVSSEHDIRRATVAHSIGYAMPRAKKLEAIRQIEHLEVKRLLLTWSPGIEYCLLAAGRIEAIVNDGNEPYDFIGGKLLAREAGAHITDFRGHPDSDDQNPRFIASNGGPVHEALLRVVAEG